jgi:hypothetical protein
MAGRKQSPSIESSKFGQLPARSIPGLIAINSAGQRLDVYLSPPSKLQWAKFNSRDVTPCNNFFLLNSCTGSCKFDHTPLDADEYHCLAYVRLQYPCGLKGKCRQLNCYDGNLCQHDGCVKRKSKTCRFSAEMQTMDYELAKWVTPKVGTLDADESSQRSMETYNVPMGDLIML